MIIGEVRENGVFLSNENIKFREEMTGDYERLRQTTKQRIFLGQNGLTSVNSSFISGVGVSGDNLIVRFHNSSMYQYSGYADIFDRFLKANSKGQFFNRNIRPTKRYKKIDNLPFPQNISSDSKISSLNDFELFKELDMSYIRKVAKNLIGNQIAMETVVINGVELSKYTIGNLVFFRPLIQ